MFLDDFLFLTHLFEPLPNLLIDQRYPIKTNTLAAQATVKHALILEIFKRIFAPKGYAAFLVAHPVVADSGDLLAHMQNRLYLFIIFTLKYVKNWA